MIFERIFGLAMVALGLLIWYLAHRGDDEVEASVNRALGPVVPLDDLLHEQDSAEAYDDLPDMDIDKEVRTRVVTDAAGTEWLVAEFDTIEEARAALSAQAVTTARERKAWEDEWEERLTLDFDGGAR